MIVSTPLSGKTKDYRVGKTEIETNKSNLHLIKNKVADNKQDNILLSPRDTELHVRK